MISPKNGGSVQAIVNFWGECNSKLIFLGGVDIRLVDFGGVWSHFMKIFQIINGSNGLSEGENGVHIRGRKLRRYEHPPQGVFGTHFSAVFGHEHPSPTKGPFLVFGS